MFWFFILVILTTVAIEIESKRSFTVDYEHDTFLKDGKPFRYVSGSIHYFRVPHEYWKDRLQKLRASGANAVETYIEWSFHEQEPGQYSFDGDRDIVSFIKEAQSQDLLVLLRPGPYICAERDNGGFPYWLKRINPNMKFRTTDPTYTKEVDKWFSVLLPKIRPLLYGNGGPVVAIQVENEYGFFGCDKEYMRQTRDIIKKHLNNNDVVLFTTDGWGEGNIKCGNVDGALATIDFGVDSDVKALFGNLKKVQPKGPLVNSEFYPGSADRWGTPHNTQPREKVTATLNDILAANASVNFYMFHGGTSFGFGAGSNGGGDDLDPQLTSYDFDSPLTEAGDMTQKYFDIRDVIKKYLPLPPLKPTNSQKASYGAVDTSCYLGDIFEFIDEFAGEKIESQIPLSFEALSQPNGFVLYSTKIPIHPNDPSLLKIPGLKDRAHVFINRKFKGILSRQVKVFNLPLTDVNEGDELEILVENHGRVCLGGAINEIKGLDEHVTLDNMPLTNWIHHRVPLHDSKVMSKLASKECRKVPESLKYSFIPSFFKSNFAIASEIFDSFLKLENWRKGVAFLNGFNLGRYWPVVGPQDTLYVPKDRLKAQNELVLFELEFSPCVIDESGCHSAQFLDTHIINVTTPYRG